MVSIKTLLLCKSLRERFLLFYVCGPHQFCAVTMHDTEVGALAIMYRQSGTDSPSGADLKSTALILRGEKCCPKSVRRFPFQVRPHKPCTVINEREGSRNVNRNFNYSHLNLDFSDEASSMLRRLKRCVVLF